MTTSIAVDFGTSSTAIARRAGDAAPRTIEIPGITRAVRFRRRRDEDPETAHLIPSVIHYADGKTLIGEQVFAAGLIDDRNTWRWMKRSIALGANKRKRTPQGEKGAADAGEDFLRLVLRYISADVALDSEQFVFTAPVEAFEDFQDWLRRVAERAGIGRVRMLDEPTASILGYEGAVREEDRFLVFDFGGGTLDVSAVRIDLDANDGKTAVQLGQAGSELGGMDIDGWIADDLLAREDLTASERKDVRPAVLSAAERTKIELSAPGSETAELSCSVAGRDFRMIYRRSCERCASGDRPEPSERAAREACLGCLLSSSDFSRRVRDTIDRALENAAIHSGLRRGDLSAVVLTGGTSLVPAVRRVLLDAFADKVRLDSPYDAVVRGALAGWVAPRLQHDYAIESFSRERGEFEFRPLFRTGTPYPSPPNAAQFWAKGSYDGMTRIGILVFEVSEMTERVFDVALVDETGALRDTSRVRTDRRYICLNRDNPTFIVADPPIDLARDAERFRCSFAVDGHRRLLVTVRDEMTGAVLFEGHPVVRL